MKTETFRMEWKKMAGFSGLKACIYTVSLFCSYCSDSMFNDNTYSISEKTKEQSVFFIALNELVSGSDLCENFALTSARTKLSRVSFKNGKAGIIVSSDIISKLSILSKDTKLNQASGAVLNNSYFKYSLQSDNIGTCKTGQDIENTYSNALGFFLVNNVNEKKAVLSFLQTGFYLLFLETGDPNLNPTDIYAVME